MNNGQPIPPFLIIVTIITVGTLLIGSNYFVNVEGAVWSDYDSMKKLVQAIEDGKVNDNSINWPNFRASDIYQNVSNNTQKCLNLSPDNIIGVSVHVPHDTYNARNCLQKSFYQRVED